MAEMQAALTHEKVRNHESFMNWITFHEEDGLEQGGEAHITKKDIVVIIRTVESDLAASEQELTYKCGEIIGGKITLAFLNYVLGENQKAKLSMQEARSFLEICTEQNIMDEGYLEAFQYILAGVSVYLQVQNAVESDEDVLNLESLKSFNELSLKSQAVILVVKVRYLGNFRKIDQQISLIKQVIEMDPENYEWHLELYKLIRWGRRGQIEKNLNTASRFEPTVEERQAIITAMELDCENPMCILYFCLMLAEVAQCRHRSGGNRISPAVVLKTTGQKNIFISVNAIVEYITQQSKKLLEIYPESATINHQISEIFLRNLPNKNTDLARSCLQKALEISPNSSKLHHKYGCFLLSGPHSDFTSAQEHFEIAVRNDARNFPAMADLLKIYNRDPSGNYEHFKQLEHLELVDGWTAENRYHVKFLKGCFLFAEGNDDSINEAIRYWIDIVDESTADRKKTLPFKDLKNFAYRYHWPQCVKDALSPNKIANRISEALESPDENFFCNRKALAELLKVVTNA